MRTSDTSRRLAWCLALVLWPAVAPAQRGLRSAELFDIGVYGARCDGTTDDTAAVQTAIAAAAARANGGTVVVPAGVGSGVCRLTANVTVPADVQLRFDAGVLFSVAAGTTLLIKGPFEAPLSRVFLLNGTSKVRFGGGSDPSPITTIHPAWWGAMNNGTLATQTAAAINAAFAALPLNTLAPDIGNPEGGGTVFLPTGVYSIDRPIQMVQADTTGNAVSYRLEGASMFGTVIVWRGGHSTDMVTLGSTHSVLNAYIGRLSLVNPALSGSDHTAVRALGINGINLHPSPAFVGLNNVMVEQIFLTGLTNGIVNAPASPNGMNQITIQNNVFDLIYNQTSPVANPRTDPLVAARGNGIYFGANAIPSGVHVINNEFSQVQGYLFDSAAAAMPNLDLVGNSMESASGWWTRRRGFRLQYFGTAHIRDNQITSATGPLIDLGSAGLGSSNASGAVVTGNYLTITGVNAGNNPAIQVTHGDGVIIAGNTMFGIGGTGISTQPGIKLFQTATNTQIGANNWVAGNSFYPRLAIDSGPAAPLNLVVTDPAAGLTGLRFDPEQTFELYDDFEGAPSGATWATSTTVTYTRVAWTSAATGSYAWHSPRTTGTPNGVVTIAGDGAGGAGGIICCAIAFPIKRMSGPLLLKVRWAQRGTGAGTRFIGLSATATPLNADVDSSVYFRHAAGGNIVAVCRGAGTDAATLDTGVAAAAGVFHAGRIVGRGTSAAEPLDVYVDGVYRGSFCAGAVPGSNLTLAAGSSATATADGLDVDYLYAAQSRR